MSFASALTGVEVGTSYGTPALRVGKNLMCRLREDGETLMLGSPRHAQAAGCPSLTSSLIRPRRTVRSYASGMASNVGQMETSPETFRLLKDPRFLRYGWAKFLSLLAQNALIYGLFIDVI